MKRLSTVLGTVLALSCAAAFAEGSAAETAKPAATAAPAKKHAVNLPDIKLIAIGKMGEEASVTLELPAGAGKPGERIRKTFRKGAVVSGSGYTVQAVGEDSVTLARDGKQETLKLSKGGASGGLPGMPGMGGDITTVMDRFAKMSPEDRAKVKGDMQKARQMIALLKGMSMMDDPKMDPTAKEKLGLVEEMMGKADGLFTMAEQLEAAKAAGDTAKQEELTRAMETGIKEIDGLKTRAEALQMMPPAMRGAGGTAPAADVKVEIPNKAE